jgi:hypothetical protein
MGNHLLKERVKTYIFIKLFNQYEAKDRTIQECNNTKEIYQIMLEEVSLNSSFGILLSCQINL